MGQLRVLYFYLQTECLIVSFLLLRLRGRTVTRV